jgi:hypothetical protein
LEIAWSESSAAEVTQRYDDAVRISGFQGILDLDALLDSFGTSSVWYLSSKEDHLVNLSSQGF